MYIHHSTLTQRQISAQRWLGKPKLDLSRLGSSKRQRGFSIIEIMVASVIVAISIMGIAALQMTSVRSASNVDMNNKVSFILEHLFESMRLNPDATAAGNYTVDLTASAYSCDSGTADSITDCVGDASSVCSTSDMAAFHIKQAMCGNASGAELSQGIKQSLPNSRLEISCEGDCDANEDYSVVNVRLEWSDAEIRAGASNANDLEVQSYIRRKQ